ncbi:MAG TPA: glycosyltransferase family 9 protein [Rhodocyclaceae bacterium]|nr:glycosyltransferase family 9 protein [Rhodocyclaceae bacterium]
MIGTPRSILVINVTRIGDTLLATPALRALAKRWPEAKITVLAHPNRAEVLEHLPFLHAVGTIEKKRAVLMGRMPGRSYDLALVYGHDAALVEYALRVAKRVVAFRQEDHGLNDRLSLAVEEAKPYSEHAVHGALRLVRALGVEPAGLRLAFEVTPEEQGEARARLRTLEMDRASPRIGLKVVSFPTKAYRDWPLECFEELCRRVRARWPGAGFIIFAGPDEKDMVRGLVDRLGAPAVQLAGLSLRAAGAMMAELDAYVGVDTGPTHIMGTFDVPMVGLYHCLLPRSVYGPLDHPLDFSLDHPRLGGDCSESTPMAEMTVDMVFNRLQEALVAGGFR